MKKEVNRERKLPAFSLGIGELEALWSHLTALFDDSADIYASIQIRLPLEQLEFANLEELGQYAHFHQGSRTSTSGSRTCGRGAES